MKSLITALVVLSSISAYAKVDSQKLNCSQLQNVVQSEGAVLIYTGPYIYDLYVRDGSQCAVNQTTEPAWVSATDTNQCFVGYTCEEKSSRNGNN